MKPMPPFSLLRLARRPGTLLGICWHNIVVNSSRQRRYATVKSLQCPDFDDDDR
jgi:hypothetical protein